MKNSKILIVTFLIISFFTLGFAEEKAEIMKKGFKYTPKFGYIAILNIDNGKVIDEYKEESTHLWHPQIIDNYMYVNAHSPRSKMVKAYNLDTKELLWQVNSDNFGRFKKNSRAKGKIYQDNNLFIINGNEVIALDAKTGKKFWSYKNDSEKLFHAISLLDNLILAEAQLSRKIYALDIKSSSLQWSFDNIEDMFYVLSISSNPILLVTYSRRLMALDPNTGRKLWEVENVDFGSDSIFEIFKEGVFVKKLQQDYGNKFLEYISLRDGKSIWKTEIGLSDIHIVIDENDLFLGNYRYLSKINASTGKLLWNIKIPGYGASTNMLCDKDSLYLAPGWVAYKISKAKGIRLWNWETKLHFCEIFKYKSSIYLISGHSNTVLCINSINGKELWRWNVPGTDYTIFSFDISESRGELYLNLVDKSLLIE